MTSAPEQRPAAAAHAGEAGRARTALALLAVVAATALALLPALRAGFVWDDALLVRDNRHLGGAGALRYALSHGFWDIEAGRSGELAANYYRPAVTALFVLVHALAGRAAWAYHALVLLAHLAAVALAWRFFRKMLGDRALPVGAATALFALHGTRGESVFWIVGLTDVLMALPALAALTAAAHGRAVQRARALRWSDALWSGAFTALALAAKETALVLPLALGAVAYATRSRGAERRRAVALFAGPSALVVVAYLALRARYMPFGPAAAPPPVGRHALLAVETLGRYAGLVAWPFPLTSLRSALQLDRDGALAVSPAWVAAGALVLLGLPVLAARVRRLREPNVALGVALAAVFLAPVLNVRWTGLLYLVADRMLYVPMVGVGLLVGALLARVPASGQRAALLAVGGLVVAHAGALALRGTDYRDEQTFWSAENALHPNTPVVLSGLASAELERGRPGRAFLLLERALAAMPAFASEERLAAEAYLAFDVALRVVPDSDRASLESALRFDRALRDARTGVAEAVLLGHQFRLHRHALAAWLQREDAHVAMSEALLLSRLGRADEALPLAHDALARCGRRCVDAHLNAALLHARVRDWDGAEALAARARVLDPALPAPRTLLAQLAEARRHAADAARSPSPVERALTDAELDLFFAAPEAARARLAPLSASPRRELLRARVALAEYRFAEADQIVAALRDGAPPEAAPAFASLAQYAATQRRRAEGLEQELAAR